MSDPGHLDIYRIVVGGEIGPRFAQVFDNFAVEHTNDVSTLVGPIRDHAQLDGILNLLAALGADIISVSNTCG